MKTSLKTAVLTAALLLPLTAAANPPAWAGHGKAQAGHHRMHQSDGDERFSDSEQQRLRGYIHEHPDDPALPPGLRKKVESGRSLPPGWQKKVRVGRTLPDDLYYRSDPVPPRFYGDQYQRRDGYTDLLLGDKVVRVLDATQTIVDVFGLNQ